MSYSFTTNLGLSMANPGTGQAFVTADVNANWSAIDTFAGTTNTSLGTLTTNLTNLSNRHQVQAGATQANFIAADLTALALITVAAGAQTGDTATVTEGGAVFSFNQVTPVWTQLTPATFASSAARDTAYAKASAAYLVQGAQVRRTDTGWVEQYSALYNSGTNPVGAVTAGWYPVTGLLPYISARNLTATAITAATYTLISAAWGAMTDLFGWTYSAGVFTCVIPGWYSIAAHVKVPVTSTPLVIQVLKSSTTLDGAADVAEANTANAQAGLSKVDAVGRDKFVVGDTIRMYIFTNTGGTPVNPNDIRLDLTYGGPARF